MSKVSVRLSRRGFIGLAATSAAVGPFFAFPHRALASRKTLTIAKWAHFVPEYDRWFDEVLAQEWGKRHDIKVVVDNIHVEQIHARAAGEVEAGEGHDVFMFPWPPAEFQKHAIDHAEIYQTVAFKFGNLDRLAHKSTFDPKAKRYFAFADSWSPAPLHYFEDYWAQVGMPFGPVHYGSLRSGAQRIRTELGIPCGLALAPSLESNVTLYTLLYAFRSSVIDAAGDVTIGRNARTVEALKYVKALYAEAGAPDQLAWESSDNVRAMLARKTSCSINAISLLRAAEKNNPAIAQKIRLSPPLVGSAARWRFRT
jgi:multiple sugar transport system substrate-binding protein